MLNRHTTFMSNVNKLSFKVNLVLAVLLCISIHQVNLRANERQVLEDEQYAMNLAQGLMDVSVNALHKNVKKKKTQASQQIANLTSIGGRR